MRNLKIRSAIVNDTWLFSGNDNHDNDDNNNTNDNGNSDGDGVQQGASSLARLLPSVREIEALCGNVEDRIFCACAAGIYELSSSAEPLLINWAHHRNDGTEIIAFDHLSDEYDVLCVVLSSGTVILVNSNESGDIEKHDIVPAEVCAARWAPDYHVLLLASKKMLYFITRQFDILNEQPLNSTRSGREELMTIGWGSRETQFQGAAARRRPKKDDDEQPTAVDECDQHRVLISWNGDANYVVVSYVDDQSSIRRFCVYDHEGELISRLEQIGGFEETLAYRPTGNLIATSRIRNGKREIIFYERNGQRRSQFELGPQEGKLIEWLAWNTDGNILSVRLRNPGEIVQEVQFWCVSNYDWMLKYRIVIRSGFLLTYWHEINPNQFCYVTNSGRTVFVDFDFAYDFHDGIVLSITGRNVRVTDLSLAPIPPPMCHYELIFPDSVCEVAQSDGIAVFLLSNHSVHAYKLCEGKFEKYGEYDTAFLQNDSICYNLCMDKSKRFSAIVACSTYALYSLALKNTNLEESTCLYSSNKPFIWHSCAPNGYLMQTIDGECFFLQKDMNDENGFMKIQRFSAAASALHHCFYVQEKDCLFGISVKGSDLVVNGRSIFRYVGSYTVDENYLLAVTFDSQSAKLQIIKVDDILTMGDREIKGTNRAVERGAFLIGHERTGSRVWLQMPRGNLETIHLRVLLLNKLKEFLNGCHLKDAALMMKKHRIDMNLFYDHNPELFMKNIGHFVDDIGNAELLNLFVASLNNGDVTKGMYSESYNNDRNVQLPESGKTKVQIVCAALREQILSLADDARITELYTTVIATYLKDQPPQIAKALLDLRERSSKLPNGAQLEEKWIAYVSVLAPNENLFKVALSTYDLNLALAVARNSQMDPKEYMPLIAEFQAHSPAAYQKFQIDIYLGLYERAIRNLSEMDDRWNEAVEIIRRQNLYPQALEIYHGKKTYMEVCELYANHLMEKRHFDEAALLFRRANNIALALQCYQNAHKWKRVIECAQVMGIEKETLNNILKKLMPHFESNGKFREIAEILAFIDEKSNESEILEYYCKADAWDCAMDFAARNEDLIKIFHENACVRCEQILQNLTTWESLLEQYSSRLEVVRQNKKDTLNEAIERCADHEVSGSEVFSEISTTMSDLSKTSAISTASARRRKHIEKKKKVLKEGSQYEDAALLNAMKDVITLIDTRQDELVLLLPALIAVDAVSKARILQSRYLVLIKYAQKITASAWPPYLSPHLIPGPLREIYRGEDGVIRLPDENTMPARIPFEQELIRPQIRNVRWQLQICS